MCLNNLNKNDDVCLTIDFLNFSKGKQGQKSPLNVLVKLFSLGAFLLNDLNRCLLIVVVIIVV